MNARTIFGNHVEARVHHRQFRITVCLVLALQTDGVAELVHRHDIQVVDKNVLVPDPEAVSPGVVWAPTDVRLDDGIAPSVYGHSHRQSDAAPAESVLLQPLGA